jgi:hypothetical protein
MLDFHGFCFAFSDIASTPVYTVYTGVDIPHLKAIYDKIIANPNYAKESVDEDALFIIRRYENAVDAIITLTNRIHIDKRVLDILTKMFDWLRTHSQCMFDDETHQSFKKMCLKNTSYRDMVVNLLEDYTDQQLRCLCGILAKRWNVVDLDREFFEVCVSMF